MNNLHRQLAPISSAAWEQIEQESQAMPEIPSSASSS